MWQTKKPTLIIAMQVGCHWCEASAGFYRELMSADINEAFRLIIIFPQGTADSQAFLSKIGLSRVDVRQADFDKIHVLATPTLILTDPRGTIVSDWVGYQDPSKQNDIFTKLGLPNRAHIEKEGRAQATAGATPVPGPR
jgi:thioredoxin-related protein